MKVKLIFAMCSFLIGCSSSQSMDPRVVVLTYGESSVSALIQEDSVFAGSNDTGMETVEFSGKITKQGADYLVDVIIIREANTGNAHQNLNTTVVLQSEEPVVIGSFNDDLFYIFLKK
jgi:hypothetical protein